jgi:cell division protein FtsW
VARDAQAARRRGRLVGLLILQPDFGSLSLILAITAGMLVLGGVNMPRMFGPVLVGLPMLAAIAIAEPYRVRRFTSFLDPWADPFDSGYQLTNALMAVGRGEVFGVGLGASVQKLSYLPEAHTDFILAVIAEELGFVGVCARDRAVRFARGPRVLGRPEVRGDAPPLRRLLRVRRRLVDEPAEFRVDRREPRAAADQGPDAAADFLRRFERADDLHGAWPVVARVLRTRSRRAPGRAPARRSTAAPSGGQLPATHANRSRAAATASARGTSRLRQRVEPTLGKTA